MPLRGPEPRSCQSKLGAGEGSWARISAGQPPSPLLVASMSSLIVPVRPAEVERLPDAVGREAVVLRGGGGQHVAAGDRRGRIADQHVRVGQDARVREIGAAGADQRRSDRGRRRRSWSCCRARRGRRSSARDRARRRGRPAAGPPSKVSQKAGASKPQVPGCGTYVVGTSGWSNGTSGSVPASERGPPLAAGATARTRSASEADARGAASAHGDAARVFMAPPAARRPDRDRRARP